MPCAIVDHAAHADYRESDLRALLHSGLEALVAGWDVLGRNRSALDLINELIVLCRLIRIRLHDRLDVASDTRILAGSTCLLLVGVVELRPLADRLPVCYLRLANLDLCLVLSLHPLDVDIKMKLAHSPDDRLVGLRIDIGLECRVLLREAVEGLRHVVSGLLVNRLDSERDNRGRDIHAGHRVVERWIAEGVS